MAESFLTKWTRVIKETQLKGDPLEGFVMQPEQSEASRAAAIIAGHDEIMALGVERMTAFHGFVQEVLATTVEPELDRLASENRRLQFRIECQRNELARLNARIKDQQSGERSKC